MGTAWRDVRYAVRTLRRSPGFTAAAVLTLALGIGPTATLFNVMAGVLLRPLPFHQPEELVWIWERTPQGRRSTTSAANFLEWRRHSTSFSTMAAYDFLGFDLGGADRPENVVGAAVSANLFDVLGVRPALGRTFAPGEEDPAHSRVTVLSHRLWQRKFAGDPGALGRQIILNDRSYTIIGVLPQDFWLFLDLLDVFVPLGWEAGILTDRGNRGYDVIARPRAGITSPQAQAEMDAIALRMAAAYPATHEAWGVELQPVQAHYLAYFRPALRVLLAAVGLVLLITCANVANLLLARGVARGRELAIRMALGARRFALLRQAVTESILLALAGGAVGLLLAWWSGGLLAALLPEDLQHRLPGGVAAIGVDGTLLAFVAGLAAATGLLTGLLPAWQSSRLDPVAALKQGGAAAGGRQGRLRHALVAWQAGLAVVALVAGILLVRNLQQITQADLGFRPEGVLRVGLSLSSARYPTATHRAMRYQEILERAAGLPGVERAALTSGLLPPPNHPGGPFVIEGRPPASAAEAPTANARLVTPDYFRLMQIPLLAGRGFAQADGPGAPGVVILGRTVAERHWPAGDALGQRIRIGAPREEGPWLTVVGIAEDVRHPLAPAGAVLLYRPLAQAPTPFASLLIRSAVDPRQQALAVETAVWSTDANLSVWGTMTLEELLAEEISHPRFTTVLAAVLAGLALGLAALGVYSSSAYAVSRRTKEIGIRMALGASRREVFRLVLGQAMRWVGLGMVAGLGVAALVARTPLVTSQLHGSLAGDPLPYATGALMLVAAALAGCWLPAWRATRVEPMAALRDE